ncbi:DUF6397 family protein [Streptomyces sp. NPDC001902]
MAVKETVVREALGMQRAREELCLEAEEFEVALQTGEVRTAPAVGGRRRVVREDVDRLRAEEGFPDRLRARLELVGSIEGAALIGISRERFTRLAKGGFLRPVRWYVNRYRAVVWLYLAEDVRRFARTHPALLEGRLPAELRDALDEGEDHRARGWRARRVEELVRDAEGAWGEAAAWSALLGPELAADAVPDTRERAYLRRLCPALPPGSTGAYATRELIEAQTVAGHPDEITFAQVSLADALLRARTSRPAPRPERATPADIPAVTPGPPIAPPPPAPPPPPPTAPRSRWRRLLGLG